MWILARRPRTRARGGGEPHVHVHHVEEGAMVVGEQVIEHLGTEEGEATS